MVRIRIDELPSENLLTPEKLNPICDAGPREFRPTRETFEDRQLPAASMTASAGSSEGITLDTNHALCGATGVHGAPLDDTAQNLAGRITYFHNVAVFSPDSVTTMVVPGTVVTGPDAHTWVFLNNGSILRWDGGSWTQVTSAVTASDGSVWVLDSGRKDSSGDSAVLRWDGSALSTTGGFASTIATHGGQVWNMKADHSIYVSTGFTPLGEGLGNGLWEFQRGVVAADGAVWFLDRSWKDSSGDSAVLRWDGSGISAPGDFASTLNNYGGQVWTMKANHSGWWVA